MHRQHKVNKRKQFKNSSEAKYKKEYIMRKGSIKNILNTKKRMNSLEQVLENTNIKEILN
jgi:hypothetical protein